MLKQISTYLPWILVILIAIGAYWIVYLPLQKDIECLKQNYRTIQAEIRHGIIIDNHPHQLNYQRHEDESTASDETYYRQHLNDRLLKVEPDEVQKVLDGQGKQVENEFEGGVANTGVDGDDGENEAIDGDGEDGAMGEDEAMTGDETMDVGDENDELAEMIYTRSDPLSERFVGNDLPLDCSDIISTDAPIKSQSKSPSTRIPIMVRKKI